MSTVSNPIGSEALCGSTSVVTAAKGIGHRLRAVVYHEYGSPDVLSVRNVAKPTLQDDSVLVKVHAASVNSWDWDLLTGKPLWSRGSGLRRPRREVLGCDIAGTVEAVGTEVRRFRPGDPVFGDISGHGFGGFAEFVAVPEAPLCHMPLGLGFEQAAAIPQACVLALQGLRDTGGMRSGQRILINGAGGGVGTFGVQLAKLAGAEVTCVDRADKLDVLTSLGADHVIDFRERDFTRTGIRYDLILDVVARRSISAYRRSLTPGGVAVIVGGSMSTILQTVTVGFLLPRSGGRTRLLLHHPNAEDLDHLGQLCASGDIAPVIDRIYPLADTAEAMRRIGEGRVLGKIVITM